MRIATIIAGFALLVAGIAMLALPGPGLLTIAAGLAILAREFHWARRLLDRLKHTTAWVGRKAGRDSNGAKATESDRSSRH
jgi:uncharacterized protein (TIGR02611 family)